MNFPAYAQWNPFIVRIEGHPIVGTRLKATMKPEGSNGMTFTPTVLQSDPNREFRWLGHLFFPGLFDGEHSFRIEPISEGRCRLLHEETFRGVLVPLFLKQLQTGTLAGFHAMNKALKARAEQG
jgi:hypothetical protein